MDDSISRQLQTYRQRWNYYYLYITICTLTRVHSSYGLLTLIIIFHPENMKIFNVFLLFDNVGNFSRPNTSQTI